MRFATHESARFQINLQCLRAQTRFIANSIMPSSDAYRNAGGSMCGRPLNNGCGGVYTILGGQFEMSNSQLIVFTFKESLYCCCHLCDSLLACSSNKALTVWDFADGKMITQHSLPPEAAPIAVTRLRENNEAVTLLLQLKEGAAIIFIYHKATRHIDKTHQYQFEMIGFTRLPLTTYQYDPKGKIQKIAEEHFFTIRYPNTIERRVALTGLIQQQIEVDQTKLEDVSFMLTYSIQSIVYFLVVEEGGAFKQFALDHHSTLTEPNRTLSIPSKAELNIVLSVELISNHRAYACLRNDCVFIINLKELHIEQKLNLNSYRMIKSIPTHQQDSLYAICSKNELCLLQNNQIKTRERVQKSFILDIDTFQYGVIGVSEEGKILFLPLL